MKALKKIVSAAVAVGLAAVAEAAWVKEEQLWRMDFSPESMKPFAKDLIKGTSYAPDEGVDGALHCLSTNNVGTRNFTMPLDVSKIAGPILVEARVKGIGVERGEYHFCGPNLMIHYENPAATNVRRRRAWRKLASEFGTFDWKTWSLVDVIPPNVSNLAMVVTLQQCRGELWVDDITIWRAREVPDDEVRPPASNPAADAIPRGPWAGRARPGARRGVMSGRDLSEDAFRTLRDWGANLIRLQISVPPKGITTDEDYLLALSNRLNETVVHLDRCRRYGLKACLDLHGGPRTEKTKHAANVVPEGYDTTLLRRAWRMIATRFGGDPAVYGYDILNEPSCSTRTWQRVFAETVAEIRAVDAATPVITESLVTYYPPEMNVIYSPHFYSPHSLTHYGVGTQWKVRWSYLNYINGVWWDKDQLRVAMKEIIDFSLAHPDARVYIGEFSCISWVRNADAYLNDCIELFEEYGWDWTYHAFREWPPWDVEKEPGALYDTDPSHIRPAKGDTARKRALLKGFRRGTEAAVDEIPFRHALPRMRVGERRCGSSNSGEFAVPGVATTTDNEFGMFLWSLRKVVQADRRKVFVDGRALTCSINWIRDHIHQSKAFCHWEHDLTSFLDFILDTQRADGQFFEMVLPLDRSQHWQSVPADCRRLYPDDFLSLVRFELEADIEYLMAEGCERAWRATGDDDWLKAALPRLEKGLDYMTSDPKRWDAARGLVKRGYTIDTWDFTFVADPQTGRDIRKIVPGLTPMAVMHGDNTGVYAAMRALARLRRRFGEPEKADVWERRAAALKERIMSQLWNGRFFTHQVPTDGFAARDAHETARLSLSDAYALNRGILSLEERRAVISEYRRRRDTTAAFAEWFTIDPPYAPDFGPPGGGVPCGEYVNGAICPITAGELAKGALESGFEAYGWDILCRVMALVKDNGGQLHFLYHPQTRAPQGRGPSGWGAAAVLSAVDEGLAGIRDLDKGYREMAFAPRWAVTPYEELRYVTGYEVSGKYVDVRYVRTAKGLRYRLKSPAETVRAHVLLPDGAQPARLMVDGRETAFQAVRVGESTYVDAVLRPQGGCVDLTVTFAAEDDELRTVAATALRPRGPERGEKE